MYKIPLVALRLFGKYPDKDLHSLNDEQLIVRYAQTGNKEIIGLLYQRYTHLLFALCFKFLGNEADAEDMVMQVFEKLFDLLKVQQVQHFKSWIYTLTRNECLMQLRHKKSTDKLKEENLKKLDAEIMENIPGEHPYSGNIEHRIRNLPDAIVKLSTEQKMCIELFYLNEQSYLQIQQSTGFTYNEVKSHIQNAKRNLKLMMERMERYE